MSANVIAKVAGFNEPVVIVQDGGDVQAGIDLLTSGRTSKEKVIVLGDHSVSSTLNVPSYTILETYGSLTADTLDDIAIIKNADANNTAIEIIGGDLDVNLEASKRGLAFSHVSDLKINGVNVKDSGTHCIDLKGCTDYHVDYGILENAGDDGLSILYCVDGTVNGVRVKGGSNNSTGGGSAGIEIEDGTRGLSITNCIITDIQDSVASGIHLIIDGPTTPGPSGCSDITISGNIINGGLGRGIGILNNKNDVTINSMTGLAGGGEVTCTVDAGHDLDDNSDTGYGLLIQGVDDSGLEILNGYYLATYVNSTQFTIEATVTGSYTASSANINFGHINMTVSGNIITDTALSGLSYLNSRSISTIANVVTRCGQAGTDVGISLGNMSHCTLAANDVSYSGTDNISISSSDHITIDGGTSHNAGVITVNKWSCLLNACTNSVVTNLQCSDDRDTPRAYGIRSLSGGTNEIVDNTVTTCKARTEGRVTPTTDDIVKGNRGHITKNSDSTGAIASGATVAHGLAGNLVPAYVNVTPKDTGVTDFYVTVDANNITVNYSGGGTHDFFWEAHQEIAA